VSNKARVFEKKERLQKGGPTALNLI
jgi:hypothetical protein